MYYFIKWLLFSYFLFYFCGYWWPSKLFQDHKAVMAQNWEITGWDINIRCPMELFSERFVTRILQRPLVFIPGRLCKMSGTKVFYLNRRSSASQRACLWTYSGQNLSVLISIIKQIVPAPGSRWFRPPRHATHHRRRRALYTPLSLALH